MVAEKEIEPVMALVSVAILIGILTMTLLLIETKENP